MVLAILIHNVPEGLAVGAAYAGPQDTAGAQAGASVALAIGLQNMPEGLIVAMALRTLGRSAAQAWARGRAHRPGRAPGRHPGCGGAGQRACVFYPLGLALAAGARCCSW